MGRVTDFAKRRIAAYLVFWFVVLFIVFVVYKGNQPVPVAWIFIFAFAFTASMAYASRLKRKQRERREAEQRPAR